MKMARREILARGQNAGRPVRNSGMTIFALSLKGGTNL